MGALLDCFDRRSLLLITRCLAGEGCMHYLEDVEKPDVFNCLGQLLLFAQSCSHQLLRL